MALQRYTDVKLFYDDVAGTLGKREVENNLPLGIIARGVADQGGQDWWMASQGEGRLISLQTPPKNLLLCTDSDEVSDAELIELMDALDAHGFAPMGVTAEKNLARRFAGLYAGRKNYSVEVTVELRSYILTEVLDVPLVGKIREFAPEDRFYIPFWMLHMGLDCSLGGTLEDSVSGFDYRLDPTNAYTGYVLEVEGEPVSIAGLARTLPHGRSVAMVYTPPYLRGKGYATSCVAQVSRTVLEAGYEYCALFTDLSNPTSNDIYQKIGYRPVRDDSELRFVAK